MEPQWQYALELVKLGYWVFPLADGGKLPRRIRAKGANHDDLLPEARKLRLVDDKGRGGFYAAQNEVDVVEMWAESMPRANYGVVCGERVGLTVIDMDRHGPVQDGIEVVKRWSQGRTGNVAFWVTTPSDGLHAYYRGFSGISRTVVSGVELQNWGRYVVGPACKTLKGMYRGYGDPGCLNEAPEWLQMAVQGGSGGSGKTEKMSLLTCVATYGYVPEGYRHDAVFMEAVLMVAEERDDEDIFSELRGLIDMHVVGGDKFADDEIRRNIKNARRNYKGAE